MPAQASLALGGLPIGLAHNCQVTREIPEGQPVTWADVDIDESLHAVQIRREMERSFANR